DVAVERDPSQFIGKRGAQVCLSRIEDRDDLGSRLEPIDRLQDVLHPPAVTDHPEPAHPSHLPAPAITCFASDGPILPDRMGSLAIECYGTMTRTRVSSAQDVNPGTRKDPHA